jgi:RNA polymerase sigma-B factor
MTLDNFPAEFHAPRAVHGDPDVAILFRRWHEQGDRWAREELIANFMPLARKLASRYRNPHEPFDDLVQVAAIGLIGAVDRFDPERGVAFSSFAVPTILGELKRYFRSTAWSVHVPRRAQELSLRVDQASRALTARHGRKPSVHQLSQYLELGVEDVMDGLDATSAHYAASLDAPAAASDDEVAREPLGETMGYDDDRLELVDTAVSLSSALRLLPLRARQALELRVNHELKQVEIADRLGCSQMQVSRLLKRASTRVRDLGVIS